MADEPTPPEPLSRRLRPSRQRLTLDVDKMRDRIGMVETGLYLIVGVFLIAAGALILFDTVRGLLEGLIDHDPAGELGLRVLDRILLLLIVAELLFTLQLVISRGEIATEPFLFIGIIAGPTRAARHRLQLLDLPHPARRRSRADGRHPQRAPRVKLTPAGRGG